MRKISWTNTHSFYADTGGFVIDTSEEEEDFILGSQMLTVSTNGIRLLAQCGFLPNISLRPTQDRGKERRTIRQPNVALHLNQVNVRSWELVSQALNSFPVARNSILKSITIPFSGDCQYVIMRAETRGANLLTESSSNWKRRELLSQEMPLLSLTAFCLATAAYGAVHIAA